MSNAGWAFGHHSYSGLELAGLTDAALKVEIESARDFLISNGFNLSSSFFSYPAGTISSRTKDALIASGGLMARTRSGTAANKNFNYPAPFFCPSEYEQYAYPIGNILGVAQLTNLKTRITEAINYGSTLWLYLTGTIKTSGVADGDILETEFQQLIDFIVQNRCSIDPVSTVKYYYGLNTSRLRK
jgi:peptidoglycan/xylan/chitin deacetylase (PgdA/CDA1 family)